MKITINQETGYNTVRTKNQETGNDHLKKKNQEIGNDLVRTKNQETGNDPVRTKTQETGNDRLRAKNQEIGNDPVRTKNQEIGNEHVRTKNQEIGTNLRITIFAFRISKINHERRSPWVRVMFFWYSESCYYIDGTLLFAPMRHLTNPWSTALEASLLTITPPMWRNEDV